jgi:prefoldin subunit 5
LNKKTIFKKGDITMIKKTVGKLFIFTLIVIVVCATVYAEASRMPTGQISYQGLLLDSKGQKVHGTASIVFTIYDNNGTALWTETHSAVAVQHGLYSVVLGSVTPIDASMFASSEPRYLELTVNGEVLSPKQLITGAAYALSARTVPLEAETDPLFRTWKETDYSTQSNAIWAALEEKLAKEGGVLTGPVTGSFFGVFGGDGAGLTNIQASGITLTNVVEKTGSIMSGPLTNNSVIFIKGIMFLNETNSITNWNMLPVQPAVVSATNILSADIEELKTATQTLNTAVGSLTSATQDFTAVIGNLNTATQTLNATVGNLDTATQTLNTAVGNLDTATQTLNTAVGTLNASVVEIQNGTNLWNDAVIVKVGTGVLTPGKIYYLASGQAWQEACATNAATAGGILGIALGTSPAKGLLLIGKLNGNYTAGAPLYLSTTAGELTTTAPAGSNEIVRVIGYGLGGNEFLFHPDRTYIEVVGE